MQFDQTGQVHNQDTMPTHDGIPGFTRENATHSSPTDDDDDDDDGAQTDRPTTTGRIAITSIIASILKFMKFFSSGRYYIFTQFAPIIAF